MIAGALGSRITPSTCLVPLRRAFAKQLLWAPLLAVSCLRQNRTPGDSMRYALWKIRFGLQSLIREEDGQDLVEYALLILICVLASVASVGSVATIVYSYFQYILTHLWW